ncbi:hypothetical protein ACLB1S_14805 [Escherichia coli]
MATPVRRASVYDLVLANYGLDRGLEDENSAKDYAEIKPYTPALGEQITGVPRQYIETIAREFADTAHKTHGRSMIILGAGVNHWYHMDMNYRGMIKDADSLWLCSGKAVAGWAHYVGQAKNCAHKPAGCHWPLRSTGTDHRANEQHLVFYNHRSQWRDEKVAQELLSPLAHASKYSGHLIHFNVRAERMGWLHLLRRSWGVTRSGLKLKPTRPDPPPQNYTAQALKSAIYVWPANNQIAAALLRNLFVWC